MVPRIVTIVSLILVAAGCSIDTAATSDQAAAHKTQRSAMAQAAAGEVPADAPRALAQSDADDVVASFPISTAGDDQKPATAVHQFDTAMLRMIGGEAPESFSSLPPDERALMSSVVDALAGFRHSLQDPSAMMEAKSAPLIALSDEIRSQAPLSIPTLALCRSVTQFGMYDPFDPARFTAGKETPTIVYCELNDFRSQLNSENRWETKLSYEAVLYTEGDTSVSVISKKPANIIDVCRNHRHDFFLADRLTIPANLPVGKYVLKVTVVDQLANHVAEKTIPLLIAPGT